jgi:hypothetical protein
LHVWEFDDVHWQKITGKNRRGLRRARRGGMTGFRGEAFRNGSDLNPIPRGWVTRKTPFSHDCVNSIFLSKTVLQQKFLLIPVRTQDEPVSRVAQAFRR